jgi:long-chain acyl-CoA synthetase
MNTTTLNPAVAAQLACEFGTIADMVRLQARVQPDHAALIQDSGALTYAEFDRRIDQVARALQRDGLQPRELVAISAATSFEYAAVFFGALRAGLAVAPLAPDLLASQLAAMVADSGARLLFADGAVQAHLAAAAGGLAARVVSLDDSDPGRALSNWLAAPGVKPAPVAVQPDWTFSIIYSSGTTGTPKGIAMPHSYRWAALAMFQALGYTPESVVMISIPLYSNMTLSSFLPSLAMGCTLVLMAKFDAGRWLALAAQHRVSHCMLVPVQYQRLLAHANFDRTDLGAFRVKSCGSAPFAPGIKADAARRWPGELVEYYGMTEGGAVCTLDTRKFPEKLHTVGRPVPGHEMHVIDEQGQVLPPGSIGEIVGRSGVMMIGYHNQPQKTAEAEWFDAQGQRFIRTGDVGRFDEDGFLVLMDRKKDMIISGGFNVYPSDLEAVIAAHPAVAEVAVAGVPSQRWGETPVAFVILRADAAPSMPDPAEALLAWANERLGRKQRLAAVDLVESLPRNGIGKVLKRDLREAWVHSGRQLA